MDQGLIERIEQEINALSYALQEWHQLAPKEVVVAGVMLEYMCKEGSFPMLCSAGKKLKSDKRVGENSGAAYPSFLKSKGVLTQEGLEPGAWQFTNEAQVCMGVIAQEGGKIIITNEVLCLKGAERELWNHMKHRGRGKEVEIAETFFGFCAQAVGVEEEWVRVTLRAFEKRNILRCEMNGKKGKLIILGGGPNKKTIAVGEEKRTPPSQPIRERIAPPASTTPQENGGMPEKVRKLSVAKLIEGMKKDRELHEQEIQEAEKNLAKLKIERDALERTITAVEEAVGKMIV